MTRLVLARLGGRADGSCAAGAALPEAMAAAVAGVEVILAEAGRDDEPALPAAVAGILAGARGTDPEPADNAGRAVHQNE